MENRIGTNMNHAVFALFASVAILVTGCGGGTEEATPLERNAVWHCLGGSGWDVNPNQRTLDYIAQDASEGALEADSGDNTVTIAFERTENDAARTLAAYETVADGSPTDDILAQDRNAVIVWANTPTRVERQTVQDCLI